MTSIPLFTALRMIRIALGYGSRTERITRMVNSTDPDVAITARSLEASGYLRPSLGTLRIVPDDQRLPWQKPRNADLR